MLKVAVLVMTLALTACAVPLTHGGQSVKLVPESKKDRCEVIKLITFNQRLGPDKPGNALKSALNEVAAAGGNGFYLINSSTDWAEGASVAGEALKCN